jgi:L-Ala-D/L-Glu epimerase / N-acetyl-D-glutamate racemase
MLKYGIENMNYIQKGRPFSMQIDAKPIDLRLTTPFRISRGVQNVASNAIVQINFNGYTGYGEAAPDEFYGENVETVLACISQFAGNLGDDPFVIEDILNNLEHIIRLNPSVKASVDMALYDLIGKMLNVPVYKLLGLNPAHSAYTSFTLGIDSPTNMAKKALLARDYPILKVKVGTKNDMPSLMLFEKSRRRQFAWMQTQHGLPKRRLRLLMLWHLITLSSWSNPHHLVTFWG